MNEERTGKCIRQVEHIRGHLWHRYSITVNQVMVANLKFSKWWKRCSLGSIWGLTFYSDVANICMTTNKTSIAPPLLIEVTVPRQNSERSCICVRRYRLQGWFQDLKLRGGFKKLRRAEGYFVWKITILRQKIIFFSNFRGERVLGAPPPESAPVLCLFLWFCLLDFGTVQTV